VKDTNVYYSVTKSLSYCSINNSATKVVEGEPYSATITANDGYELKSVTVTMGGSPVTVTNGVINVASVTGNIVITAVAEEATVANVNQIPLSTDASGNPFNNGQGWKTGYRLSGSSGNESAQTGTEVTGFMPYIHGDIVSIEGIIDDGSHVIGMYDENYAKVITIAISNLGTFDGSKITPNLKGATNNGATSDQIPKIRYLRICANTIDNSSVVTITKSNV
jgi:hypothetical protein